MLISCKLRACTTLADGTRAPVSLVYRAESNIKRDLQSLDERQRALLYTACTGVSMFDFTRRR